jgi:hypothetical protein
LFIPVLLAASLLGAPTTAPAATPQQIFTEVSSGMLFVTTTCPDGTWTGSGFLVGPQVMITARHVIQPEGDTSCQTAVTQEGTGVRAVVRQWTSWYSVSEQDIPITDFATVLLDRPLTGYYFSLAASEPHIGDGVLGLGYSLGNPLSFNQGRVMQFANQQGVRTLVLNLLGAEGSSGGPILNLSGQVIGLTQLGSTSSGSSNIVSLDLPWFTAGKASALCQGVASGQQSTLCANTGTTVPQRPSGAGRGTPAMPQCWITDRDSWKSSDKIFQTSDQHPSLYFVLSFAPALPRKVNVALVDTSPSGVPDSPSIYTLKTGWKLWRVSITWDPTQPPPQAGVWIFRMTLDTGAACGYAVNFTHS